MRRLHRFFYLAALLILGTTTQAHADTCNGFANNLVSNCGFETGSFAGWSGTSTLDLNSGVDSLAPYSGTYEAYLGSVRTPTTLSQVLSTVAGSTYLIEFALMNDTSPSTGYTNSFSAMFGANSIFAESAVIAGGYTLYSFSGLATSASTALSFTSRNDGGAFDLDSVSVTGLNIPVSATPEPSSWLLFGTGMIGCAGVVRLRLFEARA